MTRQIDQNTYIDTKLQLNSYFSIVYYNILYFIKHSFADFHLNKPLVIGEFNQEHGGGMSSENMFEWAYSKGYSGAWTWSRTDVNWNGQLRGINHLKSRTDHGNVAIHL